MGINHFKITETIKCMYIYQEILNPKTDVVSEDDFFYLQTMDNILN